MTFPVQNQEEHQWISRRSHSSYDTSNTTDIIPHNFAMSETKSDPDLRPYITAMVTMNRMQTELSQEFEAARRIYHEDKEEAVRIMNDLKTQIHMQSQEIHEQKTEIDTLSTTVFALSDEKEELERKIKAQEEALLQEERRQAAIHQQMAEVQAHNRKIKETLLEQLWDQYKHPNVQTNLGWARNACFAGGVATGFIPIGAALGGAIEASSRLIFSPRSRRQLLPEIQRLCNELGRNYEQELARADYEISHSLTLVGKTTLKFGRKG